MIYCVRCADILDAHERTKKYIEKLKPHVSEVRRFRQYPIIKLKDGSEIHFVSHIHYKTWCKGVTYKLIINGEIDKHTYHSGYPFEKSNEKTKSSD